MIAKTSSGKSFGGLMHYLEVGRSGREYERVDWTASRNLCDIDDPEIAGRLMEATAEQSLRVQKPAYHVSVAFDPNDTVDRPRMELVADRVIRDLGLSEHQSMFVAHRDREHAHVHIVVNRVHPDTGVAWERWQDQPKIERTLRGMERELGLREVPGRLYRAPGHELAQRALETSGERHARERTHEMSFAEKVREHLPELRQARSWEDLADRLAERGLKIEPKGQGIVITDGGEQQVRASRVARDLSVNRLEQKFEAPFPGKALNEPGREIDPAVRSLVRDIRSYDEVTRHEKALGAAELRAGEAAEHAHQLDRAVRDWRHRAEDVVRSAGCSKHPKRPEPDSPNSSVRMARKPSHDSCTTARSNSGVFKQSIAQASFLYGAMTGQLEQKRGSSESRSMTTALRSKVSGRSYAQAVR